MKKIIEIVKTIINLFQAKKKFEEVLPIIFDDIDRYMPGVIGNANSWEVEELIARSIQKATGKKAKKSQVKKIVKLYSPIKNAAKLFGS
ncbi:MAG: hypothetical protein ACO24H_02390 [Polynucleobacter sp.]